MVCCYKGSKLTIFEILRDFFVLSYIVCLCYPYIRVNQLYDSDHSIALVWALCMMISLQQENDSKQCIPIQFELAEATYVASEDQLGYKSADHDYFQSLAATAIIIILRFSLPPVPFQLALRY